MTADPVRPELIEDSEVRSAEQDRLGHKAIAHQIVDLVAQVPTPANVALYGPWGSGKTGIANLVEVVLKADYGQQRYKFVRFDAFKFAETPLRRNFISAVAASLSVQSPKYHTDLYSGVTQTRFSLPKIQIWALVKTFIIAFVSVCAVLIAVAALLALAQNGPWHTDFTQNSRSFLVAGFPFAALLTGILALATKAFGTEHRTERADSAEQFEQLFRDLVIDSKAGKLVVFVDEVDRCAPGEVVATLDVIRTFLGVEKCVFVVAADQQVLETALTTDVRQATPDDALNPYYSSGSAYLDKVFQYQIAVPPLPNQSVTQYAVELVENRAGVWQSTRRETVVSVLVPSHVRSPRRVKHLLNSYVVAHRVATERATSGLLDTWNEDRAIELAKLVCLQVEFPIFARGMIEVPLLPEYVQAAAQEGSDNWADAFPYIRPREKGMAEQFARGTRAVDQVLSQPVGLDDSTPDPESSEVEQAHGLQLLDYLARTASIRGPERDLIYMQTLGAPFGLPGDMAERVIGASQNGRLDAVQQELTDGNANALLDLVVQQVRTSLGVERRNVASVALALLRDNKFDLTDRADAIVTSLAPPLHDDPDLVDASSIPGLWRLTAASALDESTRLAQTVVGSQPLRDDPQLAGELLADVDRIISIAPSVVDELLSQYVVSPDVDEFINSISQATSGAIAKLLSVAPGLVSELSQVWTDADAAKSRIDVDTKTAADYAALQPYQRPAAPATTVLPGDEAAIAKPHSLVAALNRWATKLADDDDKQALQGLLRVALKVDRAEAREFVESHLATAGRWATQADNDLLLQRLARRPMDSMPTWLAAVDVGVASSSIVEDVLAKVGVGLWKPEAASASVSAIGTQLGQLLALCTKEQSQSISLKVIEPIDSVVSDDVEASARIVDLDRASMLIGCNVIMPDLVAQVEGHNLSETLTTEIDVQGAESPYVEYVITSLTKLIDSWGANEPIVLASELLNALQSCPWLPDPLETILRLRAQAQAGVSEETPSLDNVLKMVDDYSASAVDLGAAWLLARVGNAEPADVSRLVIHLRAYNAWQNEGFCTALQTLRLGLTGTDQLALVRALIADRFSLSQSILKAVGFAELLDEAAVETIANRMSIASNNSERREVMGLTTSRSYSERHARRRYVGEIVIPLFSKGVEATSLALDAISHLGSPFPSEMRDPVKRALKPAIEGNDRLVRKATELLSPLGFPTKGKGPLGIGGRVLKFD